MACSFECLTLIAVRIAADRCEPGIRRFMLMRRDLFPDEARGGDAQIFAVLAVRAFGVCTRRDMADPRVHRFIMAVGDREFHEWQFALSCSTMLQP